MNKPARHPHCPAVYAIDGLVPVVDPDAYVHPSAVLIGDVIVGAGCYIGPCASLRGDFGRIVIGARVSLQDNCVVHGDPALDTIVEDDAIVGHCAVLHSCIVRSNALIGINAVLLDACEIGRHAMVAAGAVVKPGMVVPPRALVAGSPARVARQLSDKEVKRNVDGAHVYAVLARRCRDTMRATEPLPAVEAERKRIVNHEWV